MKLTPNQQAKYDFVKANFKKGDVVSKFRKKFGYSDKTPDDVLYNKIANYWNTAKRYEGVK